MCELSELRRGREIFGWWQSKISGKHLDSLQPTAYRNRCTTQEKCQEIRAGKIIDDLMSRRMSISIEE